MIDIRPVFLIVGIFVAGFGSFMLIPMVVDLLVANEDWKAFAVSAFICGAIGSGMAVSCWGSAQNITTKQSFLITTASWFALVFAASLPLWLSSMDMTYTDAFFEAMSGLTTTGATVVSGLDTAPPGFLLWRSILQWIGGVGVVILAIAVLPFLSVGGMQLFRSEGFEQEKILPGATQIAVAIMGIYLLFTAICYASYRLFGMDAFDAINHAMTTIATGGMSTHDASFGYFLDPASGVHGPVDIVATIFMIVGSLPFAVFLFAMRGNWRFMFTDQQIRFFLFATLASITIIAARLIPNEFFDVGLSIRHAAFNVVSIFTGTGYATTDYSLWGPFSIGFFFCIMFVGGCAGSTSCGLKIFRLQIVFAALSLYGKRLAHPHRSTVIRYNGRKITDDVYLSVLSFFFIYFATFATVAVLLSLFQLDTVTALSAAGSAIANVGPGLGDIVGPAGNYIPLPDGAKWILSFAMMLGRLEFLTVLVLFMPSFWQR